MVMEDNTRFLADRIWRKILPPALICNIFVLVATHIVAFFLISHFCLKSELVIYSTFLPFWFLFFIVQYFFAIGGSQCFSIYKGAGKHPVAQQVFAEVFTSQLLLTTVGSLLGFWLMPYIVRFLAVPQESVPLAIRYGRLLVVVGLFDVSSTMLRFFLQADSLPRTGAVVAIIQVGMVIAGMYLCFCALHWGLMAYCWIDLGISVIGIIVYLILFFSRETTLRPEFRRMRRKTFRELAALSSHNIINNGGVFVISLLNTRWLMGAFGPAAVTIFALLSMLSTCCEFFRDAYVSSMQALTGIYRGEANLNGIRLVCRKGFLSSLYLQIGSALFLLCFPELVCNWMQVLENFPGEAVLAVRLFALSIPFCHACVFFSGYYVICGYDKFIVFCSLAGNFLLCFLTTAFFMLILRNERLCWWYYPLVWIFTFVFFAVAVQWKKRKENKADFMLLPKNVLSGKQYHFLLKNQADDFQDYRIMLGAFLRKQAVEEKTGERVKHLFEELFLFAGEQVGDRDDAPFFVVITILEKEIELALRYDSRESCLNSALNGVQTAVSPECIAGAKLLSRLSDNIYIDRIYGINYIRLTLKR